MQNDDTPQDAPTTATRTLLIVEDDPTVSHELQRFFGKHYTTRCASTVSGARLLLEKPDGYAGAVIDVGLPDGSGMDIAQHIRAQGCTFPMMILTAFFEKPVVRNAQLLGAEYVPKPPEESALRAFMERLHDHEISYAEREAAVLAEFARVHRLTRREQDVVRLAFRDVPRPDMPKALDISKDTVKTHARSVTKKTKFRTLVELAAHLRRLVRDAHEANKGPESPG